MRINQIVDTKHSKWIGVRLPAVGLAAALAVSAAAHADPDGPVVTGSKFVNKATVTNLNIESQQGSSGSGSGGGGFGRFSLRGKGSKSVEGRDASANVSTINVLSGTVSGTEILHDVTLANANIKGANVEVGTTNIGR